MDRRAFIFENTELVHPPLVPEIRLRLAHEAIPIWQKTEEELGHIGLSPPFWAFAWAGGQALARFILDNPNLVKNKSCIDLASGSGLVGIAAAKSGASDILAVDIDEFAINAIAINAAENHVEMMYSGENLLDCTPPEFDFVLIGDLFYEKATAQKVLNWAQKAQEQGVEVLVGDPNRAYFPTHLFEKLHEYSVPVSRELEDSEIKRTAVWRLK
jgi:predicted nicotinamide N-methyase